MSISGIRPHFISTGCETPVLNRSFKLHDYQQQTADVPIEGIVCVEVNVRPEEAFREAEWLVAQAHQYPCIQAILTFAPLDDYPYLVPFLEALVALDPMIKGVRRNIQAEIFPGFCLQPDFVRGVQLLARYNLSFDLCLTHKQLPDGIELVRRCPDTRILLDHLGKPALRAHMLKPWCEHMRQLAEFDNVSCKISGIVIEVDHENWKEDDLAPYFSMLKRLFDNDHIFSDSEQDHIRSLRCMHLPVQVPEEDHPIPELVQVLLHALQQENLLKPLKWKYCG